MDRASDDIIDRVDADAVRHFASLVGHELRTPLAVIQSAARVVETDEHGLSDDQQDGVDAITRNVELALLLLDRLSAASDVERGTLELRLERFDLRDLVQTTVRDLERTVLDPHPVSVQAPAETVEVTADPQRIRQVLFNLLTNAAKFSPPRLPIEVHLDRVDAHVEVVVRDHGFGVAPEDAERVFDRFVRLDPDSQGSGIGLYVSRGIARAHGGDLMTEQAESDGSRFVLLLPAGGPEA